MKSILLSCLVTIFVYAHPHVFVDVKFDIEIENDKAVIDISWYFDEMTSQLIMMDFDINQNGKLEQNEIDYIEKKAFAHMSSFGYYTYLYQNTQSLDHSNPQKFTALVDKNKVVYTFTLKSEIDLSQKMLKISSFDKESLVSFSIDKNTKVRTQNQTINLLSVDIKKEDMDYYMVHMLVVQWEKI